MKDINTKIAAIIILDQSSVEVALVDVCWHLTFSTFLVIPVINIHDYFAGVKVG